MLFRSELDRRSGRLQLLRLSEDVEGQIDYLQEEYLARNVPLTAALSEKKARQLTNEAARLVLDLLLQGGDDR